MTRLDQALRWWRNNVPEGKGVYYDGIPLRHFWVLHKAHLLKQGASASKLFAFWQLRKKL